MENGQVGSRRRVPTASGGDLASEGSERVARADLADWFGRLAGWIPDLAAAGLLVGVLLYWEPHDGGLDLRPHALVGAWAAVASLALVGEARRLRPISRWLLIAWSFGALVSFAFAVERSNFVPAALTYGVVPVVFLGTQRVWRRRYGRVLLPVLLLVSFGAYSHRAYLQWWGTTLSGSDPVWLALSWRNQSAALMGMFGCLFLGGALMARSRLAVAGGIAAAGAFAGVWLSGSRGGVAATAVGAAVVASGVLRWSTERPVAQLAGRLATVAVAVVLVVFSLSAMRPGGGQPLAERDQAAGTNAVARLHHMAAALRMFVDRPTVGHGLGSYAELSPEYATPGANLVERPHSQYANALAEGGIPFGTATLVVSAGLALVTWRRLRGPPVGSSPDELRLVVTIGAAGALVLLLVHMGIDFDWKYPVLPALGAVAAGVVATRPEAALAPRRWAMAVLPLVLVLLLGVLGVSVELDGPADGVAAGPTELARDGEPWNARSMASRVFALAGREEVVGAEMALARGLRWSPANDRLRVAALVVDHARGDLTTSALVERMLTHEPTWFRSYFQVADYLTQTGERSRSTELLRSLLRDLEAEAGANLLLTREVYLHLIRASVGDCDMAARWASAAIEWSGSSELEGFASTVDEVRRAACGNDG